MRVMYVITGLHKGGAEGQLLELSARMKRRGHELMVVSGLPIDGKYPTYAKDIEANGVPVRSLKIGLGQLNPLALPRLARLVWRMRPQVVHSLMVHSNVLTRLARLISPEPVLVNTALGISESSAPERSSRPRELAYTVTDWLSDVTTQVSEACAARYVELKAVPARKMRVVPCGVDTVRFQRFDAAGRAGARKEFGLEHDGFIFVCVARFTTDKDHRTLIEAFERVHRAEPTTRLVLKGIGALEGEVREKVKAAGLEAQVRFITERVAIERLLNACDGFVLSSVREGMPTVLLEAAGCGLPIVATAVGGNPEVATAKNGLLVPASDPAALAEAMLKLIRMPAAERETMAQEGRRLVEEQYDFERVTGQYEALYRELLAKKGMPS